MEGCKYTRLFIAKNPIKVLIEDIHDDDLDVFFMISPIDGNKLDKELYDEVREDLGLPEFDYSKLPKEYELVNR